MRGVMLPVRACSFSFNEKIITGAANVYLGVNMKEILLSCKTVIFIYCGLWIRILPL